jgi:hypothetical protein
MLGNGSEDMQRQPRRVRIVDGDELDAGVHQRGDERQIAREAIELGDAQTRLALAAESESPLKLRPIIALAGFNLRELGNWRCRAEISPNGGLLRLKAKP